MNKIDMIKQRQEQVCARIKKDIAKNEELLAQIEKLEQDEKEKRRQRSFAGKVSALRRKHPKLHVEKDPTMLEVGVTDVWYVSDDRLHCPEVGGPTVTVVEDPWDNNHFCYSWEQVYDRCLEIIEYLDHGVQP
tara:strand:+ start:3069 stop:3467 length:399 start_codon:yes stop_codon:yes gene_type:complete